MLFHSRFHLDPAHNARLTMVTNTADQPGFWNKVQEHSEANRG